MKRTRFIIVLVALFAVPAGVSAEGVDLVVEADSYTPPFYRGRALPTQNSGARVVALPDLKTPAGVRYGPDLVTYEWISNGRKVAGASGRGKHTYELSRSLAAREPLVSVTAVSPDGRVSASESVRVETHRPELLLYYENSLYGILYENALTGTARFTGAEAILYGVPYYFDVSDPTELSYEWLVNGVEALKGIEDNTFRILAPEGEDGGRVSISLVGKNDATLTSASTRMFLTY